MTDALRETRTQTLVWREMLREMEPEMPLPQTMRPAPRGAMQLRQMQLRIGETMSAMLEYAGSPASRCDASASHSPIPLRYVWHHIQPQEAGGQTVSANLVQVCDSCHYTIHRLMWIYRLIALGQAITDVQQYDITHPPRRAQLTLAAQGYEACRIAGTIDHIPNEG